MRTSITLCSADKQLVESVWELKSPEIEFDQLFMKSLPPPDFIHEITAYVEGATALISFLGLLFKHLKSAKSQQKGTVNININFAENSAKVIQFIESNKGDIKVIVNESKIDKK